MIFSDLPSSCDWKNLTCNPFRSLPAHAVTPICWFYMGSCCLGSCQNIQGWEFKSLLFVNLFLKLVVAGSISVRDNDNAINFGAKANLKSNSLFRQQTLPILPASNGLTRAVVGAIGHKEKPRRSNRCTKRCSQSSSPLGQRSNKRVSGLSSCLVKGTTAVQIGDTRETSEPKL